jgi:Mor family transcriptional regulator
MDYLERRCPMARPRKIKYAFWVQFYRHWFGYSIEHLARKYNVSKRTIWRYLK